MFNPVMFILRLTMALSSITFRFLSYAFLRWIPSKEPLYVIPVVFLLSLLDQYLFTNLPKEIHEKKVQDKDANNITHGSVGLEEPNGHPPPPRHRRVKKAYIRKGLFPLLTGSRTHFATVNFVSISINCLLFLAVMDNLWRPIIAMDELELEFVRVGSISESGVRIMGRMPPVQLIAGEETSVLSEGARLVYRLTRPAASKWIVGGDFKGTEETDWMDTLAINGLYSGTDYECECSHYRNLRRGAKIDDDDDDVDRILLPTSPHSHHPSFPSTLKFSTAPGSCLLPC